MKWKWINLVFTEFILQYILYKYIVPLKNQNEKSESRKKFGHGGVPDKGDVKWAKTWLLGLKWN